MKLITSEYETFYQNSYWRWRRNQLTDDEKDTQDNSDSGSVAVTRLNEDQSWLDALDEEAAKRTLMEQKAYWTDEHSRTWMVSGKAGDLIRVDKDTTGWLGGDDASRQVPEAANDGINDNLNRHKQPGTSQK